MCHLISTVTLCCTHLATIQTKKYAHSDEDSGENCCSLLWYKIVVKLWYLCYFLFSVSALALPEFLEFMRSNLLNEQTAWGWKSRKERKRNCSVNNKLLVHLETSLPSGLTSETGIGLTENEHFLIPLLRYAIKQKLRCPSHMNTAVLSLLQP